MIQTVTIYFIYLFIATEIKFIGKPIKKLFFLYENTQYKKWDLGSNMTNKTQSGEFLGGPVVMTLRSHC